MGDVEEHISKLREHVPDDKTDDDIRQLIEETGGDEVSFCCFFLCLQSTYLKTYL